MYKLLSGDSFLDSYVLRQRRAVHRLNARFTTVSHVLAEKLDLRKVFFLSSCFIKLFHKSSEAQFIRAGDVNFKNKKEPPNIREGAMCPTAS